MDNFEFTNSRATRNKPFLGGGAIDDGDFPNRPKPRCRVPERPTDPEAILLQAMGVLFNEGAALCGPDGNIYPVAERAVLIGEKADSIKRIKKGLLILADYVEP